jgi:hypothetical protein
VIRLTPATPGVRRLCVCVSAPYPGLFDRACEAAGCRGLYSERFPAEGIDLGFASPGVDEVILITDLIKGLFTAAIEARMDFMPSHAPVLAAFHVGITRVEGDDLRGTAVIRIREILREMARTAEARTVPADGVLIAISDGLFDDIGAECDMGEDWIRLALARAWCRTY